MALAPISFPKDREAAFDLDGVRKILDDLCTQRTEDVESENLEIKGWCQNEKELTEKTAEACACIANLHGGFVLVGVSGDRNDTRKFSPCPYPSVTSSWLLQRIHDSTAPPVECIVRDVSGLLAQILGRGDANVFAISLPRTRYISGHMTAGGISKIRSGKECRPYYTAEDDRTKAAVPGVSIDDLSVTSIDWGMAQHQRQFNAPKEQWAENSEFLAQARLIEPFLADEEQMPRFRISLAAVLLFGKSATLSQCAPFFETVVVAPSGTARLKKNIIECIKDLIATDGPINLSLATQVPADVVRELLVNAYIHRCYRTAGPVVINVSASGFEVHSPGGLPGNLTVDGLIHCVPVYRNLLLADGARFVGLCDKIGQGIDIVYRRVLDQGFPFPDFESDDNLFRARIPLDGSVEFCEFLKRRAQALTQLDEIIVLRRLWTREPVSLYDLSSVMQRSTEFGKRILEDMCRKLMIEPTADDPHYFRLAPNLRRDIETIFQSDQMHLDSLWEA